MTVKGLIPLALIAIVATGCRVTLTDDALYTCSSDSDCGGGGWICVSGLRKSAFCCRPTDEVCDGEDNDCNGEVDEQLPSLCYDGENGTAGVGMCEAGERACHDGTPTECLGQVIPRAELCDQVDDDCDGAVDEDFDLTRDNAHCGSCNLACVGATCVGSRCLVGLVETDCADGADNENDGLPDCMDPDCSNLSCGAGCECRGGLKAELSCDNGADDDGDMAMDCADPDCAGSACGSGCSCAGGLKTETSCFDGVNNDGDSSLDCADADCTGKSCRPAPQTYTCGASGCACNGVLTPAPESLCGDMADSDCDGLTDCADTDCAGSSCGQGCVCKVGKRAEISCNDGLDNDSDGPFDCSDLADCQGASCTRPNGASGMCRSNGQCN